MVELNRFAIIRLIGLARVRRGMSIDDCGFASANTAVGHRDVGT